MELEVVAKHRVGLFWEVIKLGHTSSCLLVRNQILVLEFKFVVCIVPRSSGLRRVDIGLRHAVIFPVQILIAMPYKWQTIPQNEVTDEVQVD